MSVLGNVTLKPSVMKHKTLTGNAFFFSPWMADFNTLPWYFRLPSFQNLENVTGQRNLRGINTVSFNLFSFPILLDFWSFRDSLWFCCAGKDLNIIENPLVTVRRPFHSCKNLDGYIWSKFSVQYVWTKIQIGSCY